MFSPPDDLTAVDLGRVEGEGVAGREVADGEHHDERRQAVEPAARGSARRLVHPPPPEAHADDGHHGHADEPDEGQQAGARVEPWDADAAVADHEGIERA